METSTRYFLSLVMISVGRGAASILPAWAAREAATCEVGKGRGNWNFWFSVSTCMKS